MSNERRGRVRRTHVPPPERQGHDKQQLEVAYRLKWAKRGGARFLSHLDALRALLRALRRAELPLALSQGYNPHLKIAFGSALPLGVESEAEYLDIKLTKPLPPVEVARRMTESLPPGFMLREVRFAPSGGRALASYESVSRHVAKPLPGAGEPGGEWRSDLAERARRFLAQPSHQVERSKRRAIDVRSLVADVRSPADTGDGWAIEFDLLSGPKGAGRADELLTALGHDPTEWLVLKTEFWPLVQGTKVSPWQA